MNRSDPRSAPRKFQLQLAMNPATSRWYRVSRDLMRYFPIPRHDAIALLSSGDAREVPYLPFSRPDLMQAYETVQRAIVKAANQTTNNSTTNLNLNQRDDQ